MATLSVVKPKTDESLDSNTKGSLANQPVRFLPCAFDAQPKKVEADQEGVRLKRESFGHPAVTFLNDSKWGGIDSLEVRSYYRLLQTGQENSTRRRMFPGEGKWVSNSIRSIDDDQIFGLRPVKYVAAEQLGSRL